MPMNFPAPKLDTYRYRVTLLIGLVAVVIVPVWALFACSSAPSAPEDRSDRTTTTTVRTFRKNAPYNRPYRVKGKKYYPIDNPEGYRKRGVASWYGAESGALTSMGVKFDPKKMTAAHRTLPLPSKVKVTNLKNGRSVIVIVNDRGPFVKNRLIDLSKGAARALGIKGLAEVEVEYVENQAMSR